MPETPTKKFPKRKSTKRQPKEDFNQAAFRAMQETIRRGGEAQKN